MKCSKSMPLLLLTKSNAHTDPSSYNTTPIGLGVGPELRDVAEAKAKEINAAYVEGMRVRSRYGGTQRPYSS